MAGKRRALLIGASNYEYRGLASLPKSQADLGMLAEVLEDPRIGGFDSVEVRKDGTLSDVTHAVERLVEASEPDDLNLLHYVGHGLVTDNGDLGLAVVDTDLGLKESSTLAVEWLVTKVHTGRAGQAVIILDCCSALDPRKWPGGVGHKEGMPDLWVLSSGVEGPNSTTREGVFNGDADERWVFTGVLVDSLRSGRADLDGDGLVHIDELARHMILEVPKRANQTPVLAQSASGRALIARAPAVKPEPLTRRTVETRGYGDRPATEDLLRRHGMLQAFRALVMPQSHARDEEYAGPTVIALDGAWGVGKTSVIDLSAKLLKHEPRLDAPAEKAQRRMSAWAARKALLGRGDALWNENMVPRVSENGKPSLVTEKFEPWAHQTGEQVWAGLTRILLKVVNERFLGDDDNVIERYWFQRNIERIDRARLRRSLLKEASSPLLAVSFLALLAPIVAQMARSTDIYRFLFVKEVLGANIALIIVVAALAVGVGNLFWRYRRPAADYLPAELFVGPVTSTAFADNSGDEALRDPYRNARSGYLYLLQHDVFAALDDMKKAGHHIVLFVDDLDRCSSRTTAEVFEAINLFVNRTFPVTRFVLCLDTTAVAAHLDETHSALRGKLLDTDDPSTGWSFLRKLIQLTIPIPVISPEVLEELVDQLLPKPVTHARAETAAEQGTAERAQKDKRSGSQDTSTAALPREAETSEAMELVEHDDEVRARAVERLRDQLVRSVREAKWILSAWRYLVRVLNSVTHARAETAAEQGTAERAQKDKRSGSQDTSTAALPREAETSEAMELVEHDDEVRARIVERLRDQPVRSVREAKRILTAWQYLVRVLIVLRTGQPVSVEEAKELVVLAEISSRWPAAQRALRRSADGKCGLGSLAAVADDDLEWAWTLRKLGLHTEPHEKCAAELRELLRRYNGVRLAELAAELY